MSWELKVSAITINAPVLDLSRREDIAAVAEKLKGTQVDLYPAAIRSSRQVDQ